MFATADNTVTVADNTNNNNNNNNNDNNDNAHCLDRRIEAIMEQNIETLVQERVEYYQLKIEKVKFEHDKRIFGAPKAAGIKKYATKLAAKKHNILELQIKINKHSKMLSEGYQNIFD